jgi:Overcoming lysogenization defect protein-like, TOPRIM domain
VDDERRAGGQAAAPAVVAQELAATVGTGVRAAVLVEGASDQGAVEALARRRGRDLGAEGVAVVPIGGATSVGHFLAALGPQGLGLTLAGLCDAAEAGAFRRHLERAGLGSGLTRDDMAALGFHVCVADLEDELIRSLGVPAVEALVEAQGELRSFRILQRQPAWQGRPVREQLRRFIGTRAGRKVRYGRLLVEVLDLERVPRPLDGVLDRVLVGVAPAGRARPSLRRDQPDG